MSHFAFLRAEFPAVHEAAAKAEAAAVPDPRTACFYARRAVELLVHWVYKHDRALELPYQENVSALIHEPTFQRAAGPAVFQKAKYVVKAGNHAVHSPKPVQPMEALSAVRELFHLGYWLAHTYAAGAKPDAALTFDPAALPKTTPLPKPTADQLQKLGDALRASDDKLSAVLADKDTLDAELARLRAEIVAVKAANAATPDAHDYSEGQTRDLFIDLLLREAGWPLDQARDREFPVQGMPGGKAGKADYVLWGDDGLPLAVVEAKRTRRDARTGQQQAKLYADGLEAAFGRRPVIFCTNGYEHWLWDDTRHPPRPVQGFYARDELELLVQRRTSRKPLKGVDLNDRIVGRHYQTRAVRRVAEAFEADHLRKALLVMATGAGKTRTAIALVDLLQRCNWAKRVLFLADRVALVGQAGKAFLTHLPDAAPVNLCETKGGDGRVFVATYPTMMGLIDDTRAGRRRFGVGHFDLVVIDEAHRSVFQKYRAIFDYFDALLVGLTATPKGEVDRNTYGLFDLETGVPTDAYPLEDAVRDGYLVPAKAVAVPLRFPRQGIKKYADLTADERDQWDDLDWAEDGAVPDEVDAAAVNAWLFNADTVDKALAHLMTHGLKVAGGDRLGKTILFAKNQKHAEFIRRRFDHHYPKLKGHFAAVITCQTDHAQSLIDGFGQKDQPPHLAISVDMLDTGIDVPEVVNLVFFKPVRSKTKFWQMVGRGTRLCPDLFGPDRHKAEFHIFDFCGNLEFFAADPEPADTPAAESLGKRLFKARVELVGVLDDAAPEVTAATGELRAETAERLRGEVAAMNLENFVVRPKRRAVETYAKPEAWVTLTAAARHELATEVAGLPAELPPEPEEAKRFDLLLLRLQLAVLLHEPAFERLRDQVTGIAAALEEKATIPMVKAQLPLIQDVQSADWWADVTAPMLEVVRKRLRDLVQFIDTAHRRLVYTDFPDQIGPAAAVELPGFGAAGGEFEQFRQKARAFLRQHTDRGALRKLRWNEPLAPADLAELEGLLARSGGSAELIQAAKGAGLGVFVRSLVGLDREAAKRAFGGFLAGGTHSASQIEFVNLVVDHLTEHGVMAAGALFESPFTDLTASGPTGLFTDQQVRNLVAVLQGVQWAATAA